MGSEADKAELGHVFLPVLLFSQCPIRNHSSITSAI
jgi:hypothetical protein